ncbi:MAG: creatininase family protein [Alphaproteobacteria bacterium]|nr:creatininase family protein [Alphaproteobacteria bacterium]
MTIPSRHWADLAWTDFPRLPPETVAILPVGAIEQHGPHLPLRVDATLNAGIVERALALVPAAVPLLVLPTQGIGLSVEHARFPGTLTLQPATILALWNDIGDSVARAGLRKLLILNSHGGQPQIVDLVCQQLRGRHRMLAVGVSWWRLAGVAQVEDALPATERRHGIHGGAVETAMMMHLAPDLVRHAAFADFASTWIAREAGQQQLGPFGPAAFAWETQDLNASGAVGDPRLATPELGARLVEAASRALAALIEEIHRFDAQVYLRDSP